MFPVWLLTQEKICYSSVSCFWQHIWTEELDNWWYRCLCWGYPASGFLYLMEYKKWLQEKLPTLARSLFWDGVQFLSICWEQGQHTLLPKQLMYITADWLCKCNGILWSDIWWRIRWWVFWWSSFVALNSKILLVISGQGERAMFLPDMQISSSMAVKDQQWLTRQMKVGRDR